MSSISELQMAELKHNLINEKIQTEQLLQQNKNYGLQKSERDMSGDLSTLDNHPADSGTDVFERGKDVALNEHTELYLEEIDAALERIAQGQYGTCKQCQQPIPYERLQAVPVTQYCMQHAPNTKQADRERPVEEELMNNPFGRTSLDERDDLHSFDGEDAWQIVESWGTSNTPAMAENPNESTDYNHMFIEADENEGYVEEMESFLATDIYGNHTTVIRNRQYSRYMKSEEGDHELEVQTDEEDQ